MASLSAKSIFYPLMDSQGLFVRLGAMIFSGGSTMIWLGLHTRDAGRVQRWGCGELIEEANNEAISVSL
jgi:hypothetical protein